MHALSIFETQCKQCQATGKINLPPETGLDPLETKVNVVLEFAESLQHTSKSVERYAFLIWILCTHCGLFY